MTDPKPEPEIVIVGDTEVKVTSVTENEDGTRTLEVVGTDVIDEVGLESATIVVRD
jgi:hypothetical protein